MNVYDLEPGRHGLFELVLYERLEYYRKLDAGTRIWGQGGRPAD